MEKTSDCLIRLAKEIDEPCDKNKLLRISRELCNCVAGIIGSAEILEESK